MADFTWGIDNWAAGVIKSTEEDRSPTLLDAKNTQFWKTAQGETVIGTRPGLRRAVRFVPTSGPVVKNIKFMTSYNWPVTSSAAHTRYMVLIDESGQLAYKDMDDSWDTEVYTPPAGYPVAEVCIPPADVSAVDSATMNGRLFLLAATVRRSLFGKTYQPFGLNPPQGTVTTTATIGGTPIRLPADTYSIYLTAYNSETGAESNPTYMGDFITDGGNNGLIQVNLTASSVLADKWRIYVQRQSTQAQAYLLTDVYTLGDLIKTNDGNIPVGSTSVVVNVSATVLADLLTPVPDLYENNPMPADAVYMATFGRRLIAASKRKIYWSKLDIPDAFPPQNFENFSTTDGSEITGLCQMDNELLLVFTTTGTYGIFGLDPQYWVVKPIDANIGCVGKKSIVKFDGGVAWWSPQFGPVLMQGQQIDKIGLEGLGRLEIPAILLSGIVGGWEVGSDTVVWAYPATGDVTNTLLLPYNYRVGRWAASSWDPIEISYMATGWNANGEQRLFVSDLYYGLYYFDYREKYDGADLSTTLSGSFVASGSTVSAIDGTGFSDSIPWPLQYDLAGQRVTIVDSEGRLVARVNVRDSDSTSVGLRVDVDVTNGSTYYYYISTPYVELTTPWIDADEAFLRKRFDRLFVDFNSSYPATLTVQTKLNRNAASTVATISATSNQGVTATLDATWDVPVLLTQPFLKKRLNVWKNGHTVQFVFSQPAAETLVMSRIFMTGRMLHERYYS